MTRDAEFLARLRLARSEGVGPRTYMRLMAHFATAAEALAAMPAMSARGGRRRPLRPCPEGRAETELAALDALGGRMIFAGDADYPEALGAIPDPPPALSVLGDASRLAGPAIGMVGMRNGSAVGRKFARGLAADLGAAGVVVVSGMARGIDGAAHEGSLATGSVAVLAGGVDMPYPRENEALYRRLVEQGAAVSDQPLGTAPTARHFPPRNRIIAGLSLGVVVVEANLRSGSLITARLANEQGRVVFAVPGSPLDPRAAGPNDLLRQGAVLVERADDVIAAVEGMARPAPAPARKAPETAPAFPEEVDEGTRGAVVDRLAHTPLTVDELVRECQLSAASVQTVLLELELAGRVVRQPGNRVSLIT
ncbi:MAG: DNA-processing protein DprA [Defluviicoccus sp.]|nr:DNA-processing protein DprA [Defluviicoccus sp.]